MLIRKTKEQIKSIRNFLDTVMYSPSSELREKDFQTIREAYNLICQANDKLNKL